METNGVNVIIKNDDSVDRQLKKTAKKLHAKYTKKRKINEKFLRERTIPEKIFSGVFDAFCIVLIVLSVFMCYSNVSAKINRTNPSMAGYTNMRIATGSMIPSGHDVGDVIMVRAVDTDTLKVGDKIAFYVNYSISSKFNKDTATKIEHVYDIYDNYKLSNPSYTNSVNNFIDDFVTGKLDIDYQSPIKQKTTFDNSIKSLLGIPTDEIKKNAKRNYKQVFHHIVAIYEDKDGTRWFKTKGTNKSNNVFDDWTIRETSIIGVYDDSQTATTLANILQYISTMTGLIVCIVIPLILITIMFTPSCLRDIHRAMLELDVVEEKRKLTDEICVRNKIGYQMDYETKFKVLACAPDDQKMEYISLLWEDGTAPNNIKKFYLRKEINLQSIEKLRDLNRECEQMFKDNVPMTKIAKHYSSQRTAIEKEQANYKRILKELKIKYAGEKEII